MMVVVAQIESVRCLIKTYLGISEVGFPITNLNISGAENLSGSVSDPDLFIIDDGGGGTNRKVTALTLKN